MEGKRMGVRGRKECEFSYVGEGIERNRVNLLRIFQLA